MPVIAGRRLRAPQADGAVFADPPLAEARRLLATPPGLGDADLAGRSLRELRQEARRQQGRFRRDPDAYLAALESTLLKRSSPS